MTSGENHSSPLNDPSSAYRVADDLSVRRSFADRSQLVLSWGSGSDREYVVTRSAALATWLLTLDGSASCEALVDGAASALAVDHVSAAALVKNLQSRGMLRCAADNKKSSDGEELWLGLGWHDASEFHSATRLTRWRHEYPPNPTVMTWFQGDKPVQADSPRPAVPDQVSPSAVKLPPATAALKAVSASDAMARRTTSRNFHGTIISPQQLGDILHWTFKPLIEGKTRRYYTTQSSSDGFREQVTPCPISAYVLIDQQHGPDDLVGKGQCMRYSPSSHSLDPIQVDGEHVSKINELLWGQDFADEAPALIIFVINWNQYMWKYRLPFAYRMVHLDLGAFMQTALLTAAASGVRTFITPALDDRRTTALLGLQPYAQDPAYALAVGSSR